MKKITSLVVLLGACAMPAFAASATYKNVTVIDSMCSSKMADHADMHPRECALKCAGSGFGIITADKKFIKLDEAGNKQIEQQLKASTKEGDLRVNVSGDLSGDTIKVSSIQLQ